MIEPKTPDDEQSRLAALHFLEILDTRSEERFDRITALACDLLKVPICLISLVDEGRQWFKSRQGLDATETPRDISFCGHAILDGDTFIVEDASRDDRFADNPLVASDPNIRFYAGAPLATTDGHRIGTLCIIDRQPKQLDVADQRILENLAEIVESELRSREEIRLYNQQLEEAKRRIRDNADVKLQFLATMSHEIRTPMTSMLGYLELLEEASPEDHTEYVGIMKSSGEQLLSLINEILDHSKVEAGQMRAERVSVETTSALSDVVKLMRVRAEQKGIALTLRFDGQLPALIQTDPIRLRQILVNLVGNAVKFTESGIVEVVASFDATGERPMLSMAVHDSGIGISPEHLDGIFEPFAQAEDSISRRYGGTGLGLSLSRQLAELLGGSIEVESTLGRGSVFSLSIDAGAHEGIRSNDDLLAHSARTEQRHVAGEISGRVLIADDQPVNQRLLEKILQTHDLHSQSVADGAQAVEVAMRAKDAGEAFDLILMDMVMPVLDGYTATSRLRAEGYRGPIVALTANTQETDREKCLRSGCDEFLTKPFDRAELDRVLMRFLATSSPKPAGV